MRAYVEVHSEDGGSMSSRAWSFDLASWGIARSAETANGALSMLQRATRAPTLEVEETVEDFDPAFARDLEPAAPGERAATLTILEQARARSLALLESTDEHRLHRTSAELWDVDFGGFSDAAELAWSFADVESRRYPSALGLATREPLPDLLDELRASHVHAMQIVATLPEVLIRAAPDGGEWTSVKLLRMLAWYERAHYSLLETLLTRD